MLQKLSIDFKTLYEGVELISGMLNVEADNLSYTVELTISKNTFESEFDLVMAALTSDLKKQLKLGKQPEQSWKPAIVPPAPNPQFIPPGSEPLSLSESLPHSIKEAYEKSFGWKGHTATQVINEDHIKSLMSWDKAHPTDEIDGPFWMNYPSPYTIKNFMQESGLLPEKPEVKNESLVSKVQKAISHAAHKSKLFHPSSG